MIYQTYNKLYDKYKTLEQENHELRNRESLLYTILGIDRQTADLMISNLRNKQRHSNIANETQPQPDH